MIKIIGLKGIPLIKPGDNLANLIIKAAKNQRLKIENGDVLVIAQTIVSKAEEQIVDLAEIKPSRKAIQLAKKTGKDPKIVELILKESKDVLRTGPDFIIVETKHGFICANAGVDQSNIEKGKALLLPKNPDKCAEKIRGEIKKITGTDIAVIISDSQGRAFREGVLGTAIGVSGLIPIWDRRGDIDLFGRELKITKVAVADQLTAAASLVMGEANEGIPVVLIRGAFYHKGKGKIRELLFPKKKDVFR